MKEAKHKELHVVKLHLYKLFKNSSFFKKYCYDVLLVAVNCNLFQQDLSLMTTILPKYSGLKQYLNN